MTNTRQASAGNPRSNCCCNSLMGRPVFSKTSRARMIRRMSLACKRAAVVGSTAFNWSCSQPGAFDSDFLQQSTTKLPVGRRPLKNPPQQPFEIERGSADKQHLPPPGPDFFGNCLGRVQVLGQAEILVGGHTIDQVMAILACRCSAVGFAVPISIPR